MRVVKRVPHHYRSCATDEFFLVFSRFFFFFFYLFEEKSLGNSETSSRSKAVRRAFRNGRRDARYSARDRRVNRTETNGFSFRVFEPSDGKRRELDGFEVGSGLVTLQKKKKSPKYVALQRPECAHMLCNVCALAAVVYDKLILRNAFEQRLRFFFQRVKRRSCGFLPPRPNPTNVLERRPRETGARVRTSSRSRTERTNRVPTPYAIYARFDGAGESADCAKYYFELYPRVVTILFLDRDSICFDR